MLRIILAIAVLATSSAAHAQEFGGNARVRWTQVFASPGDDWINDIVPLSTGDVLAIGFMNRVDGEAPSDWRALAVALDEGGNVKRQNIYGEGSGVDAFWTAREDVAGDLIQIGFTNRLGAGGLDAYVALADARGDLLRETAIGDADYDRVTDMAPAADGGFVLVGHSVRPGSEERRVLVVKINARGDEEWRRLFSEGDSSGGLYIEPAHDGGFILSGGATHGDEDDMLVMKIDADGSEIWRRVVGAPGTRDVNHGLVVRPNGEIVAVGYTQSWGAENYDLLAVTLSADGDVRRHSVFGGAGDDRAIFARLDQRGEVWVVGYTQSADDSDHNVIVAALDARGRFRPGVALLAGPEDDNGTTVLPLASGDLLIGGYSASLGDGGVNAFVSRIARPNLTRRNDTRFTRRAD